MTPGRVRLPDAAAAVESKFVFAVHFRTADAAAGFRFGIPDCTEFPVNPEGCLFGSKLQDTVIRIAFPLLKMLQHPILPAVAKSFSTGVYGDGTGHGYAVSVQKKTGASQRVLLKLGCFAAAQSRGCEDCPESLCLELGDHTGPGRTLLCDGRQNHCFAALQQSGGFLLYFLHFSHPSPYGSQPYCVLESGILPVSRRS